MAGEREVGQRFEQKEWAVRGLEGKGDFLAISERKWFKPAGWKDGCDVTIRPSMTLHVEAKRQERLRIPEWLEQARTEAPPGVPPVLVFRQSRARWIACLPLDDLLRLIG